MHTHLFCCSWTKPKLFTLSGVFYNNEWRADYGTNVLLPHFLDFILCIVVLSVKTFSRVSVAYSWSSSLLFVNYSYLISFGGEVTNIIPVVWWCSSLALFSFIREHYLSRGSIWLWWMYHFCNSNYRFLKCGVFLRKLKYVYA